MNADSCGVDIDLGAALRDGTPVRLRAVRADDKERLRLAFERLSPATINRRFFHPKKVLTTEELRMVTELDFRDHVSLAMTVGEQSGERFIAVARFVRVAAGADRAELALTVVDEYQRRGAGTLLLRQLVAVARRSGIREPVALVLDENRDMLELLQKLNLAMQQTIEDGVHRVVLDLAVQPAQTDVAYVPVYDSARTLATLCASCTKRERFDDDSIGPKRYAPTRRSTDSP
jgi:GNAT superfamily N-acetyltransferase